MRKFALLIGVSESSEVDLPELPSAIEDIRAMQAVLQHPEMGGFDSVAILSNPTRQEMEEAIETLFANCKKEDLVLFYFSGHGITDEKGKLYLVTPQTRKERGSLIKATAVAATVLHDNMGNSRSKRQVLILDSCFSGAIAEGLTGKSAENKVDIQRELGGEGRAILTSSNAVQKSFHIQGYNLSIYTHYLVDGIQTGAANQDGDDYISVDELHEYAKKKLGQEAPLMSPQFFPVKEGYKIRLVRSPKGDPKLKYRKIAEQKAEAGKFSSAARQLLDILRLKLGICESDAEAINSDVLKLHQEYRQKLQIYKNTLRKCLKDETILNPTTIRDLVALHTQLELKPKDVASIEEQQNAINDIRKRPDLFDFNFPTDSKSVEYDRQKSTPVQRLKIIRKQYAMAKAALDDALLIINDDLDELHEYRAWLLGVVIKNYERIIQPFNRELLIPKQEIPAFKALGVSLDSISFNIESVIASSLKEEIDWEENGKVERLQSDVDKYCMKVAAAIKTFGFAVSEIQHFRKILNILADRVIQLCKTVKELSDKNNSSENFDENENDFVNSLYLCGNSLIKLIGIDIINSNS